MRISSKICIIVVAYVCALCFSAHVYWLIFQCASYPSNATIANVQHVPETSILHVDVMTDNYEQCIFFDFKEPWIYVNGRLVVTSIDKGVCTAIGDVSCYYSRKVIIGVFVFNTIVLLHIIWQIYKDFEYICTSKYEIPMYV